MNREDAIIIDDEEQNNCNDELKIENTFLSQKNIKNKSIQIKISDILAEHNYFKKINCKYLINLKTKKNKKGLEFSADKK
jgi:hypothetical protein